MSHAARPKVVVAIAAGHMPLIMPAGTIEALRAFADVRLLADEGEITADVTAESLRDADALMTCWGTPAVTPSMLDDAANLKIIAHTAGSVRPIACRQILQRGIVLTQGAYQIGYAVAEHTLMFILAGVKLTWAMDRELQRTRDWKAIRQPVEKLWELRGRTVGVVALSQVGEQVVPLLAPFGCKVIAYDPYATAELIERLGVETVGLEELFDRSEIVTIHLPVTDETRGMITAELLARLPDNALVVNTSRGAVIDEQALIGELRSGRLRAALDVTDPEPPAADSPLYGLENVLLTPHEAGNTIHARHSQGRQAVEDIRRVLSGGRPDRQITLEMWDRMA
ncbi:MAG TPA: hydroxyacid dehydrogenase [Phycisphaerae bacterium]|nr:hydroxyacid dehydrogenase [Phycisphaerae bacterium]